MLNDGLDYLVDQLTAAGLNATCDPRNVNPPCVLVEPPSLVVRNPATTELRFSLLALVPPPGNLDAVRALLDMADAITEQVDNCTDGEPTTWGPTDLPAYRMTATVTLRRTQT